MARTENDFYPTPPSAIRPFLKVRSLPGGRWLEPGAGAGAIVRTIAREDVVWDLVEVRPEARSDLERLPARVGALDCPVDYLGRPAPEQRYDVAIGNPPFSHAERFIAKMLREARVVVALLPLAFVAAGCRARFHLRHPSDFYVLSERPSFTGDGNDMRDVAWFVWDERRVWGPGRWQVLLPEGADAQVDLEDLAGGAR